MSKFAMRKYAVAIGLAGAMTLGVMATGSAAPVLSGTALKAAVPSDVSDVRWRGRGGHWRGGHWGGGALAAGLATGLFLGAATSSAYPYYYDYGPGPYYAYEEPVYGPGPVYVAPAPRSCWVWTDPDRGYGYNRC